LSFAKRSAVIDLSNGTNQSFVLIVLPERQQAKVRWSINVSLFSRQKADVYGRSSPHEVLP
jgi:hypothetical protein